MDKKLIFIVAIILSISIAISGFLYVTLVQTQNDLGNQIVDLENERDSLKDEISQLVNERDNAFAEVENLEGQITSLQNSVSTLTLERDEAKQERDSLQSQLTDLQNQIVTLTNEKNEAQAEIEDLEEQITELEELIIALTAPIYWEFGEDSWNSILNGGSYAVEDEILTLSAPAISQNYVSIYQSLNSSYGFLISYEVKADMLGGFALKLAENQPFFGSTDCINLEMTAPQNEDKGFQIARWVSSWTWDTFAQPEEDIWYRIEVSVQRKPGDLNYPEITYTVYEGNQFSYSATADDIKNITFWDIQYVVLECWAGECQYQIRNFEIEYS